MGTIIDLFFLILLFYSTIFLAGCSTSSSNEDGIDGGTEESEESEGDTDTTAPILSEVTARLLCLPMSMQKWFCLLLL